MDQTQTLIAIVVIVLTVLAAIISVEIVSILKEFRKSIEKINKILDNAGVVSESISRPVALISEIFVNLKRKKTKD